MATKIPTTPIERLKNYFIQKASAMQEEFEATNTDNNSLATGNKREKLLINFLNDHLPSRYEAFKGGSIFDSLGNKSDQVDVIVYDKNTPRLGTETETLYMAEGVSCSIEVKPELNGTELPKAFKKINSFKNVTKAMDTTIIVRSLKNKVYSGIFAFSSKLSSQEALTSVTEYYKEKELDYCPDFICVNNSFLIIKNDGSWEHTSDDGVRTKIADRFIPFQTSKLSLYKLLMIMCKYIYPNYLGGPDFNKYINLY